MRATTAGHSWLVKGTIALLLLGLAWGAEGGSVVVRYEFTGPALQSAEGYSRVNVRGCSPLSRIGEPAVPFRTARILLPPGQGVSGARAVLTEAARVVEVKSHVAFGRTPLPFGGNAQRRARALAAAAQDQPDRAIYGSQKPYPAERVEVVSVQRLCGYDIAILRVFPVQYVPARKQLLWGSRVRVELDLAPQDAAAVASEMPRRGRMDAARVAAFVDNPEALAGYESSVVVPGSQGKLGAQLQGDTGLYDYLLITSDTLLPSFSGLVARKQNAGLRVKTETVANIYADPTNTGRDNPEKIRFYIRSAYTSWGIQYVLLGGDVSVVPYRGAYGYVSSSETTKDLPCDLYYSCLDGDWNRDSDDAWGEPTDGPNRKEVDLLGEVYVGRAPVDTAAEVSTFVNKVIAYEENGTPNAKKALFAGEYLGDTSQGGDALDTLLPSFSGWTVEWLDDRPTLAEVWTKAQCIAKLNQSPHIVAHVGHGNETYALRMNRADVDSLTNAQLFLVNSTACDCGAFDYSDCIGEDFSKRNSRGAFAVIMNSRYGWYNATLPWMFSGEFQQTFFDRLLSKGVTNIGRALQLSKHDMVGEVETRGSMPYRWCYFEITLLGDPHTELKTVSTRTLNVKSFDATPAVNDYFTGIPIVLDPPTPQGATRTTEFTTPYAIGTQVVLAAPAAHEDLQFLRWRLDGVDQPEGQPVLSLTLSGDLQALAVYRWQSLVIDMQALKGGTGELNPTGPAPRSLTILSITVPGDPTTTQIAMTIGEGHWLRFVTEGSNVDVYATGAEADWHTAAEWASKRIRGLTPGTTYTFQAKARDGQGGQESELSDAGRYSTNLDGDVDRSGTVTEADLIFVRDAVLSGAEVGQPGKAWATDVNDTRTTTVLDVVLVRNRVLGLGP